MNGANKKIEGIHLSFFKTVTLRAGKEVFVRRSQVFNGLLGAVDCTSQTWTKKALVDIPGREQRAIV